MSDKLQKTEGAIEVAGNFGEAIERAVSQVGPHDLCAECKHTRENHCFIHEDSHCLMSGCKCKQFAEGNKPVQQYWASWVEKIVWAQKRGDRCIGNPDSTIGPHNNCPGTIGINDVAYACTCSCNNCLSAERRSLADWPNSEVDTCITYGARRGSHRDCVVIDLTAAPVVCMCDCIDCKRLWFSAGRPIVRDGKIVRTTPETVNPIKTPTIDDKFTVTGNRILDVAQAIDMLKPVEPMLVRSPVTSARGSRLIKPGSYTLVLETIDENAETITATVKETGETVEIPNPLRALRRPKP